MNFRLFIITLSILLSSLSFIQSQETKIIYLSGTGKDNAVEWDFYCTEGRNSGFWTNIPVPSCWEQHGFGEYNYGNTAAKEKGLYKYSFNVPVTWKDKVVFIVFEGSMTDTEVKINGRIAGPVHQGAFYRFQYDITKLIHPGKANLLEVTVSKVSSNYSVNQAERHADYWVFGGIFRPVYLKVVPQNYIERVAIDARDDGSFRMEVFHHITELSCTLVARIKTLPGDPVGEPSRVEARKNDRSNILSIQVADPALWSPEFPNLYQVEVNLEYQGKIIHQITERFGFRTVELRKGDGIYVNGKKILFKGVNRHSFWPESGRTTSKEISIRDIILMKEMNMNAVRMSHYPPDVHFLNACDSMGLFVLDELAGWQKPPYDTGIGKKLVREMVIRDVNHPCVVLWDNGNEGGWNTDLDNEFSKYDIQKRHVIHPWEVFDGTDTQHYKPYNYGNGVLYQGNEVFFPTEFLHGLYDGGHGAGLEDHWDLMLNNSLSAGGFLWCLIDEGVARTDLHDSIDTHKNNAPDGILGPHREKEGSYYAIKEIWSPMFVDLEYLTKEFEGQLKLENRYFYTDLSQCTFSWSLIRFPSPFASDLKSHNVISKKLVSPAIEPGGKGLIELGLPDNWKDYDALYFTATDPYGMDLFTWSWPVKSPEEMIETYNIPGDDNPSASRIIDDNVNSLTVSTGDIKVQFNKKNGRLENISIGEKLLPLQNGPVIHTTEKAVFTEMEYHESEGCVEVNVKFKDTLNIIRWKIYDTGWLKLDYRYRLNGRFNFAGIGFDFPEDAVTGATYLGDGPYRVWKNRMKGSRFGIWSKDYNNTVTGESWNYPEFKGYHANMYWAWIENNIQSFLVINAADDIYLHLFTPDKPNHPYNDFTSPPFPKNNISFLHAISPIGTKFLPPSDLGPQSQLNMYFPNSIPPVKTGELFFYFGDRPKSFVHY